MITCNHEYYDSYYGTCCRKYDLFYPDGGAPWDMLTDEEQERIDREEYAYTHGSCPFCGGEWWDGGSTCTCDLDDDEEVVA